MDNKLSIALMDIIPIEQCNDFWIVYYNPMPTCKRNLVCPVTKMSNVKLIIYTMYIIHSSMYYMYEDRLGLSIKKKEEEDNIV